MDVGKKGLILLTFFRCVEMHKRFDPAYADGKQKAKNLGGFK